MKSLNKLVSFLLELAMLGALVYWGFQVGGTLPMRLLLGLGVPVVVAIFWGKCMAPNARRRIAWPWLPLVAVMLFLGSAAALYFAGAPTAATMLAALAVINCAFVFAWHQY